MKLSAIRWCVVVVVVVVMAVAAPSLALARVQDDKMDKNISHTNVTPIIYWDISLKHHPLFDIRHSYSSVITRLRNAVEAPTRACGVQSTRRTALPGAEYLYVCLKIDNKKRLFLGIDSTTFYIWGYRDNVKYNGNYRANILHDAPEEARDNLFRGSTTRITRVGGNYNDLKRDAGVTRENLVLGIPNLEGAMRSVYGKEESVLDEGNTEAKFVLIAIQMISEAVRFKFIEQAIAQNYNISPELKNQMIAFQNKWDDISQAIHEAEDATQKCTSITPTLVISNNLYRQEVNTVDEIKYDMGLLKYKK